MSVSQIITSNLQDKELPGGHMGGVSMERETLAPCPGSDTCHHISHSVAQN